MTKLIAFDFDGNIHEDKDGNCLIRFHEALGTANKENMKMVLNLYDKFLNGHISYQEWGDQEIALWKGKDVNVLHRAVKKFNWIKGARETVSELKKRGYKLALISTGGPLRVIGPLMKSWGFDYVVMNDVKVENGVLTGSWITHVEFHDKGNALKKIAEEEGIDTQDCAVVGDNINDRSMFDEAGLSIAFCAKDEILKQKATKKIEERDMRNVLEYFP